MGVKRDRLEVIHYSITSYLAIIYEAIVKTMSVMLLQNSSELNGKCKRTIIC